MAKPVKTLELHYLMIQFLLNLLTNLDESFFFFSILCARVPKGVHKTLHLPEPLLAPEVFDETVKSW